ncbi:MAG: DegV family protein [Solobacterium sp.]|nr:DegV family protein [Solobacterium sp.]
MHDFILATASTCDIERDWLDSHDIPFISYTFEIDGNVYSDDCREETRRLFYNAMAEGKTPKTSQITTYSYYEFFKGLLAEKKPVVFADMDRAISNSYANSQAAAESIREKYPDAELYIIDTRCITMGLSLLIHKLAALRDEGKSAKEVFEWGEENGRKIAHRFLVDDLQWLRKGGRLSNASAIVGSLLSIKPLIYLNEEGSLVAYEKAHGKKKAVRELLASAAKDAGDGKGMDFIVGHSNIPGEGEEWKKLVCEQFPEAASVSLMELGPVIGSHVGPGFLSIVYFTSERKA